MTALLREVSFAHVFFRAWGGGPATSSPAEVDELEQVLCACLRSARLAWPDIVLPPERFIAFLAEKITPEGGLSSLRALHAADLYIVCACLARDPQAIAAFEARYFPGMERALARTGLTAMVADDVKGALREKLFFTRPGERSPMLGYSGRGDVGGWVRAVGVRAAIKARRSNQRVRPDMDELEVAVPSDSPELAYLKATFAAEFRAALTEAIEALPLRDRNLLRQYLLDGLTIDQFGKVYCIHRATAARWLAELRGRLLKQVHRTLAKRLRLSEAELRSAMSLARSQLDISLQRLLSPAEA